jgi:hypothetical protein
MPTYIVFIEQLHMTNPHMRNSLLFCTTLFVGSVAAQCDFDPVITPIDLLCSNGSDHLVVGLYDSYQWFQDGQPITGGDQPELMVTYEFAAGSNFTVEVTLDGCTEMSPPFFVDGYTSLPLDVIITPAPFIGAWGNARFCVGDEPELSLIPTWTNIVWTLNGVPIPGENGMSYTMTEGGTYQVTASTPECPDYYITSLPLTYAFVDVLQPDIVVPLVGFLCAYPSGDSHAWYHNGELMEENSSCITDHGSGSYTVFVEYNSLCEEIMSEPHLVTGLTPVAPAVPLRVYADRHAGRIHILLDQEGRMDITFRIIDALGRTMSAGSVPSDGMLDMHMADGTYLLQLFRNAAPLASPTRFVWM